VTWRNRIVGHGEVDPEELVANPRNFRIHPRAQQAALEGVLDEIGWVRDILVSRTTGFVIDGHARVALALRRGEPSVPVSYVDLTPKEEALVLASLDHIIGLAGTDDEQLDALLREVSTGNPALMEMFSAMAEDAGLLGGLEGVGMDDEPPMEDDQFGVLVLCDSEAEQADYFRRLSGSGYTCRLHTA
jgi:hypothetical protein